MYKQKFDPQKALEVLLYIVGSGVNNMYNALKVLYFADKKHLENYGRLICGENYVAMNHGPVPSGLYDIVKDVKFARRSFEALPLESAIAVKGNFIWPLRAPNMNLLSDSDTECLDEALQSVGKMAFSRLRELSHDDAFRSADENDFISLQSIIKTFPDGEELLEHFQSD